MSKDPWIAAMAASIAAEFNAQLATLEQENDRLRGQLRVLTDIAKKARDEHYTKATAGGPSQK